MALIAGLALTVGLVWFVGSMIRSADERRKFMQEVAASPAASAGTALMVGCVLLFFWGVLIPPFGRIPVHVGSLRLDLWQAAGLGALVCVVGYGIIEAIQSRK